MNNAIAAEYKNGKWEYEYNICNKDCKMLQTFLDQFFIMKYILEAQNS